MARIDIWKQPRIITLMIEYSTDALVLDKEYFGEADSRIFLYTKKFGKISAKATSARKITSKLNPHLEPLNFSRIRLVYKNNFQLTDALLINRFSLTNLPLMNFLKIMTQDHQPDHDLWQMSLAMLNFNQPNLEPLLKHLGFDPRFAICSICQGSPEKFDPADFVFYCSQCASQNSEIFSVKYYN